MRAFCPHPCPMRPRFRFVAIWSAILVPLAAAPLQWEDVPGGRIASLHVPDAGKSGFTLMPSERTAVLWTNVILEERVAERHNLVSGGGVALGDFDADGLCDLFLCNRGGENALFRNLGDWRFQNVTLTAGVGCGTQSSTGATFADLDGNGRLDLLVASLFGPNACFLNLGGGHFTNVTRAAGILSRGGATSLALGDLDKDGDLDLYTTYFGLESVLREGGRVTTRIVGGKPTVTGRYAKRVEIIEGKFVELGDQDVLYANDGKGVFAPLEWVKVFRNEHGQAMKDAPMDFGLAVQIRDINGDGAADIFVCNDFQTPDRIWLNDGKGRFDPLPQLAFRSMSYASMGVDFADIDRDGHLDFITVEMLSREHTSRLRQAPSSPPVNRRIGSVDEQEAVPRNVLHWNRGDGTFAEIAWFSGVAASDWSWTPIFIDVDLDGFEDLIVSTGHLYDVNDRDVTPNSSRATVSDGRRQENRKLLARYPRLNDRNAAFRNRGDLTFEDLSDAWGFDSREICHGMALADLDRDGDLDVVVNCANAAPLLYRNETSRRRVAVQLKGRPLNTQGIGAKVALLGGAVPRQEQEIICGGRYLSSDEPVRVFAAGESTRMTLEVTWADGRTSRMENVEANRFYELHEPATPPLQ